ncbi:hypothetical protein J8Y17_28170 (plasmid) [Bacillus cereus]|uniref:hypothetical protein n=1 Tax=Bacillus cereus TaxID=1396 RepID=UPI001B8AC3B8|nr:hypothetical protein [Bacillus cereus]QUW34573.1 hypothetical protein J8Y17_28170 [Bacillus cereus]
MKSKEKPTESQYKIAEQNGISRQTVNQRIKKGKKTIEQAITEPLSGEFARKHRKYIDLAKKNGIDYKTFRSRILYGKRRKWTPEEAATTPATVYRKINYQKPSKEEIKQAASIGVGEKLLDQRLRQGWTMERAITSPVGTSYEGKEKNVKILKLARNNGISDSTYYRRRKEGMAPYEAATKPKEKGFKEYIPLAEANGISNKAFYQRVKRGMKPYEAATKPAVRRKKAQQIS